MTIATFPNVAINELDEFTFIAGTYREISFYIHNSSGSPLDISSSTAYWNLVPYNQTDYISASKLGVINGDYFTVYLYDTDTKYLQGKYIQKPVVKSLTGYEYRLGQGIINIIPRIGASQ